MANPTTLLVPGADFTLNPALWVVPTSVPPSFVGAFGGSQTRSLANGANFGLTPSLITGELPAIQPGYMTTQGWNALTSRQAGIALPPAVTPGINYTFMWVGRVNTAFGNVVPVVLDPIGGGGNLICDYYAVNNITWRQRTTAALAQIASPTLPGSSTAWQALCATGQQGVGITLYIMTGGSSANASASDTNNFVLPTQLYVGGGGAGTNSGTFQGAGDVSAMVIWPSVLSAQDRAIGYAWIKNYVAKYSIVV